MEALIWSLLGYAVVPVLIVLFLEIDTSSLTSFAALVLVDTVTAYVVIRHTGSRRAIGSLELRA